MRQSARNSISSAWRSRWERWRLRLEVRWWRGPISPVCWSGKDMRWTCTAPSGASWPKEGLPMCRGSAFRPSSVSTSFRRAGVYLCWPILAKSVPETRLFRILSELKAAAYGSNATRLITGEDVFASCGWQMDWLRPTAGATFMERTAQASI